jgi:hypothetical protein
METSEPLGRREWATGVIGVLYCSSWCFTDLSLHCFLPIPIEKLKNSSLLQKQNKT